LPAGIAQQIDELDQLLDKLLQLPIDQAVSTSTPVPVLKPVQDEEPVETGILRFSPGPATPANEVASRRHTSVLPTPPSLALHEPLTTPVDNSANHTEPILQMPEEPALIDEARLPDEFTQLEPAPEIVLPVGRDLTSSSASVSADEPPPWLADEPLPVQQGQGPKVEIVQGPDAEVVRAANWVDPNPVSTAPHRPTSWFFWLLFTFTWVFDKTLGRWFPFLLRPTVKLQLGLLGFALIAISMYLAWLGFTR
jgi:hypothetical protein